MRIFVLESEIERATLKVSVVFNNLIQSMTSEKVNKSKTETEADNTREEMLKWANQVSSGRIVNNPFTSVLDQAIEDIEQEVF